MILFFDKGKRLQLQPISLSGDDVIIFS